MGVTEYVLRKFSEDRLARVSREWAAISGGDEFEVELAPLFTWCGTHLEHQDGDAHALELYAPNEGETGAILEMINGKRGSLSKLLKLHPSPKYWTADSDEELRKQLVEIYGSVFFSVISAGIDGGFDEIKIYGRNESMYRMISSLQNLWLDSDTGWTATMQGRWLSIAKSQERN